MFYFSQMWKSVVGHNVSAKVAAEGDDWETDPDFEVLVKKVFVGAKAPHSVSLTCGFHVCTLCFRTMYRSRSRGGEPRPSRARDVKNTSGKKEAGTASANLNVKKDAEK